MKLHENQLNLILHLIRLNIMAYDDCLKFLDSENTGDMVAMSYVFRPLTKNGYVSKNKEGVVTVLQKGRNLFPELVYFFSEVKGKLDNPMDGYVSPIEHFMVVYPEDLEVARMYPDVNEAKGVNIRVYRSA